MLLLIPVLTLSNIRELPGKCLMCANLISDSEEFIGLCAGFVYIPCEICKDFALEDLKYFDDQ